MSLQEVPGASDFHTSQEAVLSKPRRLQNILARLEQSEPASTALEAYDIVEEAFDESERPLLKAGILDIMTVEPYTDMKLISYVGNRALYSIRNKHVLFIGHNGSIDIRAIDPIFPVTDNLLQKQPLFPKEKMVSLFKKAGADGREVWN